MNNYFKKLFLKSNILKKFDIRGAFVKYKKYNDKYITRNTNFTNEQLAKDYFMQKKEQLEKAKVIAETISRSDL